LDRVIDEIRALGRPIVLRPFHEMNGKWFWWGPKAVGGAQSYQKFFRFTVSYIRIRANTDLALFAWSPNFPFDDKAIEYFPGADVVDVIGLDVYDIGKPNSPSWPEFKESVTAMGCFAHKHGKVAAVTETGNRRRSPEQHPSWWWLVRT
jgi:mannan endo-1,4-beta-mannosidase